jgi:hypothetical protein
MFADGQALATLQAHKPVNAAVCANADVLRLQENR